ncbi:uncharacterized protein LOC113862417 [Abrus precatorius]|uniref:Uncharacterized protein LOC113862417 n=1 Tax=Abrus precatorius TaxID=3816 RepID=A0A8B8L534_ABRPR|nr:uncharacterized protein LOC113862417 [Abrus precatorius]
MEIPLKPPDTNSFKPRWSFKKKVADAPSKHKPTRDLLKEGVMSLELEGGDRLLPKFHITPKTFEDLSQPWRKCLVFKLLGRNIGFLMMKEKLRNIWKPQEGFELMDISHGYYMVQFDEDADKEQVLQGGLWMIFDYYLIVRPWTPKFVASEARVDSTLAWVRFSSLGLMFYDQSVLLTIASALGKPIKVDVNTLNMTHGRFARVCVEIDLDKPVMGKFCLNDV